MKIKLLIIIMALSVSLFGQAKTGSTAAPFLNIGIAPRAIAMGGAFIATADDVSSLYWNPAGAARMNKSGALFSHSKWFADIDYNWAGAVINMGDAGVFGLSVTNLDYGDMELTTLSEYEGTGGTFTANDMSIAITYSKNLTDRFESDQERLSWIYHHYFKHLIKNPRELKRFFNHLRFVLEQVEGQVCFSDLFSLSIIVHNTGL